jgi:hypothetical protein
MPRAVHCAAFARSGALWVATVTAATAASVAVTVLGLLLGERYVLLGTLPFAVVAFVVFACAQVTTPTHWVVGALVLTIQAVAVAWHESRLTIAVQALFAAYMLVRVGDVLSEYGVTHTLHPPLDI